MNDLIEIIKMLPILLTKNQKYNNHSNKFTGLLFYLEQSTPLVCHLSHQVVQEIEVNSIIFATKVVPRKALINPESQIHKNHISKMFF